MKALLESIPVCRLSPSTALNISCHFFLSALSAKKSTDSLREVLLYITYCLSLVVFNIISLSLIFAILIAVCLCVAFLGLILFGTLCFLDLYVWFLAHTRGIFSYFVFRCVLCPFLSLSLLLGPFYCAC